MSYADQAARKMHPRAHPSQPSARVGLEQDASQAPAGRTQSPEETKLEGNSTKCIDEQHISSAAQAKQARTPSEKRGKQGNASLARLKGIRSSGKKALPFSAKSRRPTVTLSSVLGKAPQLFDNNKICVVERYITVIDKLPTRFKNIKMLYMSNNSLESLAGISQFQELQNLSLANNCIGDFHELLELNRSCSKLEALILEGNPVASSPSYKAQVLLRLPGLKMLDGEKISEDERRHALSVVRQEQGLVDVIISNTCLIHKLELASKLQRVHMEMRFILFGKLSALDCRADIDGCAPRSTHRLLQLWDYEGNLSFDERTLLGIEAQAAAKRQRVAMAETVPGTDAWKSAFCEVITGQQAVSATLMATIEAQHAEALTAWQTCRNRAPATLKVLRDSHEFAVQEMSSDREALICEFREAAYTLMDGLVENHTAPASVALSAYHAKGTPREQPSTRMAQAGALERQRQHALQDISNNNGILHHSTEAPQQRHQGAGKQARAADPIYLRNSSITSGEPGWSQQGGVDSHNMHSMAPGLPLRSADARAISFSDSLNSTVDTPAPQSALPLHATNVQGMSALLSQVSQLQGDLEYHAQGELHLQAINMQLRQMLETTQHKLQMSAELQSSLGEAVPELDLQDLHQGMEEALKAQQRLEHRMRRMAQEKHMIEDAARQAAAAALEAEQLAQEAMQERDLLQQTLSMIPKQHMIDDGDLRAQNMLLQNELEKLKGQEPVTPQQNDELRKLSLERDGLGNLCKEQNEHLRWHQEQLATAQLELEAFRYKERQTASVNAMSSRALMRRAWAHFRYGVRSVASNRMQWQQASGYQTTSLQRRWIGRWLLATQRVQRMAVMQRNRERCLLECAFSAMLSHQVLEKANRVNLDIASQARALSLGRQSLTAWKLWVHLFAQIDSSQCHVHPDNWRRLRTLQQCISCWHIWTQQIHLPHKAMCAWADMQYRSSLMRHSLTSFKMACAESCVKQQQMATADHHWAARVLRRWREGVSLHQAKQMRLMQAVQWRTSQLLSATLSALASAVQHRQRQAEIGELIRVRCDMALRRQALGAWLSHTRRNFTSTMVTAALSKVLSRAADAMARAGRTLAAGQAFRTWRLVALMRPKCRRSQTLLNQTATRQYARCLLSAWRRQSSILSRMETARLMREENDTLSARLNQETAALRSRLTMSQEQEKEAVLLAGELDSALQHAAETETCLQEQLRELRATASADASTYAEARGQLESKQQAAESRVAEMADQLEEKHSLLLACESALSDTVARLETVVADRESMIKQHDESNSALEKVLRHQDTRAAELADNLQRLQSDLLDRETTLASVTAENGYLRTRIADIEEELAEERQRGFLASSQADIGKLAEKELKSVRRQLQESEDEVSSLRQGLAKCKAESRSAAASAAVMEKSQGFRAVLQSVAEDSNTPDRIRKKMARTLPAAGIENDANSLSSEVAPSRPDASHNSQHGLGPSTVHSSTREHGAAESGGKVVHKVSSTVTPKGKQGGYSLTLPLAPLDTSGQKGPSIHSDKARNGSLATPSTPTSPIRILHAPVSPDGGPQGCEGDLTVAELQEVWHLRSHIQSLQSRIALHAANASPLPCSSKVIQ